MSAGYCLSIVVLNEAIGPVIRHGPNRLVFNSAEALRGKIANSMEVEEYLGKSLNLC